MTNPVPQHEKGNDILYLKQKLVFQGQLILPTISIYLFKYMPFLKLL